jgi:phosphate transport system permease protein
MHMPAAQPARSSWGDILFRAVCQSAGGFVLAVAAALLAVLVYKAWPILSDPGKYQLLTSTKWYPDGDSYGAVVFIYGTLVTSLIALVLAVPLGVGAAAFLSELAPPRLRTTCAFLLELLAAIPSVVYGFWGREFLAKQGLAPLFAGLGLANVAAGQGLLAAGLVLSVMILPYITAVSFDVMQAVPRSQREGALALGSTRWQTIWRVVLPYARPGILAACFLALGRAIGETMAVTMVIGNSHYLDFRINGTGDTIPSVIAKELFEASGIKQAALVALGLLLLLITLGMNIAARMIVRWVAKPRVHRPRPVHLSETVTPPPPRPPAEVIASRRAAVRTDRVMQAALGFCQLLTVVPLFLILGYITIRGAGGVDWDFVTKLPNDSPGRGLKHALVGSCLLVGLATAFAVPVGILAAVFLAEYRTHRWVAPIRFVAELLGGVPSIVIGIFGYALFVYPVWMETTRGRFSAWAGAFALGVMMLPVVIRATEEALRLVPHSLREASYALGAGRWQTVAKVVLPAALPAIITGVFLAVGRIAGETAPLILTARGSQFMPRSLAEPTPFLPLYVYDFARFAPGSEEIRLAWAAAFVLVLVVLLLNVGVRLLAGQRVVAAARAD